MTNISELDLQNLRHLMGGFDTTHCKMQAYAQEATDPQVKQFFEKGAKTAMDNKQQLMKFLGYGEGKMQEKIMVADTLAGINGELPRYAGMIAQSENKELKATLKQMRNACEQSQEELYNIAREKSYYVPASKATEEEVRHVKNLFTQGTL